MKEDYLKEIAERLVAKGKGILAADESTGTIKKRFESIGLESTEESRRDYREMLFETEGMEKFISGVILFDETLRQENEKGVRFSEMLSSKDVLPGIKVDKKAHDLANFPGEKVTEGLDGLRERLEGYAGLGAKFAKWRAVITIGKGIPTDGCIDANAHGLARYAALSQEAGLVPIVEPEVLMDGDHGIDRCKEVTERVLARVFGELEKYRVYLPGMLLKPNMVVAGKESKEKVAPEEVAKATVDCFRKVVPEEVVGIVFLSGGQSPEEASVNLNAINSQGKQPWELSYSFGRALQGEALKAWGGKKENVEKAQEVFYRRAERVAAAREGRLDKV